MTWSEGGSFRFSMSNGGKLEGGNALRIKRARREWGGAIVPCSLNHAPHFSESSVCALRWIRMGSDMTRTVWVLLIVSACKMSAYRRVDPTHDLHAVSDNKLTLGIVPIESDSGAQAYRLLVCKKSSTYPKWMLEDKSRCRVALLTKEGDEVAFMHDHMRLPFAVKYIGHAKLLTAWLAATVTLTSISLLGRKWTIRKFDVSGSSEVGKKIAKKINIHKSKVDYLNAKKRLTSKVDANTSVVHKVKLQETVREKEEIYVAAFDSHLLEEESKFFRKLLKDSGSSGAEKQKTVADFVVERQKIIEDLEITDKSIFAAQVHELLEVSDELQRHLDDMQGMHALLNKHLEYLDSLAATKTNTYKNLMNKRKYGIGGMEIEKMGNLVTDASGWSALVSWIGLITTSIYVSITGNAERMVSKYWSQIFLIEDKPLATQTDVKDLKPVMERLANTFGFVVNQKVFTLVDNIAGQ